MAARGRDRHGAVVALEVDLDTDRLTLTMNGQGLLPKDLSSTASMPTSPAKLPNPGGYPGRLPIRWQAKWCWSIPRRASRRLTPPVTQAEAPSPSLPL
jgi:hypothetical protein